MYLEISFSSVQKNLSSTAFPHKDFIFSPTVLVSTLSDLASG